MSKKSALLIPIQELQNRVEELKPYKGKSVIAYCRTGKRSGVAAEFWRRWVIGASIWSGESSGGTLKGFPSSTEIQSSPWLLSYLPVAILFSVL